MGITNIIAKDTSLIEIINNLNNGLFFYTELENIRITNQLKPEYVILAVEADISNDLISFIENDEEFKNHQGGHEIETSVLDFIVVTKSITPEGKMKLSSMSLLELVGLTKEIENYDKDWDFETFNFDCVEINYVEPKMEDIDTDMT